jgi:putative ABC transport system permease protein
MIDSLLIIAEQTLLHVPLMLGAYISISLMKVPDLSIESAYVFGAMLGYQSLSIASNLPAAISLPIVILGSLCGGALVGLTSSTLTQKAHLPHLLSAILTFGVFHGLTQLVGNAYVSFSVYPTNPLTMLNLVTRHPEFIVLAILGTLSIIFGFLFFKTQLGYALAAYGNNSQFFKQYDISTAYVFITGIVLSNALSGLSGYLFAQSNGFVELTMGYGKALLCITALILGKTFIPNRILSIAVPMMGVIAYFILQQLLLKIGFNLKYFTALQSIVVLAILVMRYKKSHRAADHLGV